VIPRIFHQIWLGPDPLPLKFERCRQTWARLHPDWELRLWGEDDLPADLVHKEAYDRRRSPAERSDIARLELLWRYGGVYLDVDFECRRRIDVLLGGVDFFAALLKHDRVNNAIFGAVRGHPILERALQTVTPQEIGAPFDKTKSGAHFFSDLVMNAPGVTHFPPHYFYPATPEQRAQAYAIHHYARSWKNDYGWRKAAVRAEERLDQVLAKLEKERSAHERTKRKLERLEQRLASLSAKNAPPNETAVRPARTAPQPEPGRLAILFFLRSIHFDRVFENFLRALLERGHHIHVVLALEKRGLGEGKTRLFEEFRARYAFSYEKLEPRRESWLAVSVALRHALDYLRYLEPTYAEAHPLRERAGARAPRTIRALVAVPPFGTRPGRRVLAAVLRALEVAIPIPGSIGALIEARSPDVVLVSPLVGLGSIEVDYLRAAQRARIPTVLPVASWDNLSNKGLLHDVPTTTIVWNKLQVEEAVRLHRVPRDRVVAVGAHSFDHWFSWTPSSTRAEFAHRLGLDPERPLLLYLGSSYFISGDETQFVREWLAQLRKHPRLRHVAVILRPHPQNVVGWADLDVDEPDRTLVWSRKGVAPVDDQTKRDFFDSLYHSSAAIGINTSALIEAAILRRPALTLADGRFATQAGTLHFSYIADHGDCSLVIVGRSWQEHLDQIADAVESPGASDERIDRFLSTFVRPKGLDVAAAPLAADTVERAAGETVPAMPMASLRLLAVPLTLLVWLVHHLSHPRRMRRVATKALRQLLRRWRRWQRVTARKVLRPVPRSRVQIVAPAPAAGRAAPAGERLRLERETKEKARAEKESRRAAKEKARAEKESRRAAKEKARAAKLADARRKQARARRRRRVDLRDRRKRIRKQALRAERRAAKLARKRWKLTKGDARTLYNMRFRPTYRASDWHVPSRNEIPAFLNARGLHGRGAEIGVKTGKYSAHLVRHWRGRQLISIDPWFSADPDEYVDRSNISQEEFEALYLKTKERLAPFGTRSEIWRMTSVEAASAVSDASLDFVYIDARHDYESVKEDLAAWYPKVRPGGIIAGHDYADGALVHGDFGVQTAVDEFFAEKQLPVHTTDGPSAVEMFPSWLVEIPAAQRVAELLAEAAA
jgi:hypothetical protein